jgi:hypothetical protein
MPAAQVDRFISLPVEQLRAYSQAGGQVLFGTDVGFVTDYDPAEEYLLMARAGSDIRALSNVRYTLRRGRIVYRQPS